MASEARMPRARGGPRSVVDFLLPPQAINKSERSSRQRFQRPRHSRVAKKIVVRVRLSDDRSLQVPSQVPIEIALLISTDAYLDR